MYEKKLQLDLDDFIFPIGKLDPENAWIKLAKMMPWERIEKKYAKNFENNGHPAFNVRVAFGALIIKERYKCSDEMTVEQIGENPYLQYFIGEKEYTSKCPFSAVSMTRFRKRISVEDIQEIMEMTIPKKKDNSKKKDNETNSKKSDDTPSNGTDDDTGSSDSQDKGDTREENKGVLLLDATCCPSDIAYPQDINLLNKGREQLEKTIDDLCSGVRQQKPRMYRKNARKSYLTFIRSKKRTKKQIRKAIRAQLQYVARDICYIESMFSQDIPLSEKQQKKFDVIKKVYEQQKYMYDNRTHSVADKIVSLSQPYVRPIVRGKTNAKTEFGAKLHISLVDGYARIENLSFDAYNESCDFIDCVERYNEHYGHYPKKILADKIYRNRNTLSFCKDKSIRITGPALGRPKKDTRVSKEAKREEYKDSCERNAVEGAFGTCKTRYGMGRIKARLENTSKTVIAMSLLCMNLFKMLARAFFALFLLELQKVMLMIFLDNFEAVAQPQNS